jgi:hypothetical protein
MVTNIFRVILCFADRLQAETGSRYRIGLPFHGLRSTPQISVKEWPSQVYDYVILTNPFGLWERNPVYLSQTGDEG